MRWQLKYATRHRYNSIIWSHWSQDTVLLESSDKIAVNNGVVMVTVNLDNSTLTDITRTK